MIWLLGVAGGYFVFDGIYSIIRYWNQTWQEHLIRVIRILGGLAVIYAGAVL